MDPAIKSKLPKQAKDADENLIRLQSKVLHVASSLVSLLESAHKGVLTPQQCHRDGTASPQITRACFCHYFNGQMIKASHYWELTTLVKEQETFTDAAPLLFEKDFDK